MLFLKKLFRFLLRFLLAFTGFALLIILIAFVCKFIPVNSDFKQTENGIEIFVESNGVHTDFVLPVSSPQKNWGAEFPLQYFETHDSIFQYISFGWGDKGFYLETPTWGDLKFSTAFKAVFALSTTAMHVTYHKSQPPVNEKCKRIFISVIQYEMLIKYIEETFQHADSGKIIHINHKGYHPNDTFFEAKGTYSFFKTCNVWTGNGLKKIGVKVSVWTPLDGGVLYFL